MKKSAPRSWVSLACLKIRFSVDIVALTTLIQKNFNAGLVGPSVRTEDSFGVVIIRPDRWVELEEILFRKIIMGSTICVYPNESRTQKTRS